MLSVVQTLTITTNMVLPTPNANSSNNNGGAGILFPISAAHAHRPQWMFNSLVALIIPLLVYY